MSALTERTTGRGAVITVTDLVKAYGEARAVDGLDLSIDEGETFALLGPNGAGKTTTVEILEGFRRPTSGSAEVLGATPWQAPRAWRDGIGIVQQSSTGLDLLTPREILRSTAKAYRTPRDIDEVISATGLGQKADARIGTLSGGQRRRVDVALGIVGRPRVLFLDEPTTGFDPDARREFWGLIRTLADEGTTILLTTHYLDEAEHLADRVGIIAAGRMLALDTPSRLGGRGTAAARVGWMEGGVQRSAETDRPTAYVQELATRLGLAPGQEIPELQVIRPTLEDTYLRLLHESGARSPGEIGTALDAVGHDGSARPRAGASTSTTEVAP